VPARAQHGPRWSGVTDVMILIEVLNVKQTMFILLLFASLPDCGQNQTAVSDEQYSLSDF
jgi:hypothetical protein